MIAPDRILVWDLPVRLFHGLLVGCCVGAWTVADDSRLLYLHVFLGKTALLLLASRVLWGFVGSRHARFSAFPVRLGAAVEYARALLQPPAPRHLSHHPVGAWGVWLLLTLVLALGVTGFFCLGGEEGHGPLRSLVGRTAGHRWGDAHEVIAWVGAGAVSLHVAGILVEDIVLRTGLVRGMLDGRKRGRVTEAADGPRRGAALILGGVLLAFAGWTWADAATADADHPFIPYRGDPLPMNDTWNEECGPCHLAFHPSLLPRRSWTAMWAGQHEHFGDDLALSDDTLRTLDAFAQAHATEAEESEAAWEIGRSVPGGEAPLRITKTRRWNELHARVDDAVWTHERVGGRSDCAACHEDAEAATFDDGAMRLP